MLAPVIALDSGMLLKQIWMRQAESRPNLTE
jgi:hypothetical protein